MLFEHALLLYEKKIVGLKGVWVDPNKAVYEGRILEMSRSIDGYRLTIEGLWGNKPVTIGSDQMDESQAMSATIHQNNGNLVDVQFGTLMLKIDHFRDDPQEWLAQIGIPADKSRIPEDTGPIAVGDH